jgi:urease accessory protein
MKKGLSALISIRVSVLSTLLLGIAVAMVTAAGLFSPAWAHHATGGVTPTTAIAGFMSGLAHPVIGLDHLTFVVASGLLAAVSSGGWMIPVAFVLSSLLGTGIHLLGWTLPLLEVVISGSVLLFGLLLARHQPISRNALMGLAAISGIFHGYAYGESIVGAAMIPLFAYFIGFATVQAGIALVTLAIARRLPIPEHSMPLNLRFAGFTLIGIGATFLSGAILG